MRIDSEDIIQLINKEIQWCLDNPDSAFHKEYRKGFTNGLIQAKHLIGELKKIEMAQETAMTPGEFANQMDGIWMGPGTGKQQHTLADNLVYELLRQLGYSDGASLYRAMAVNDMFNDGIYDDEYLEAIES